MAIIINKTMTSYLNSARKRDVNTIKYAVVHYTANPNSTARNNCAYYAYTNLNNVSANYFVDENEIYQCVPDDGTAGHIGAWSGCYYLTEARNSNSLGVELCCKSMSGMTASQLTGYENDLYFEDGTWIKAVQLFRMIVQKYNIPRSNVITHNMAHSGKKMCPRPMVGQDVNIYYNRVADTLFTEFVDNIYSGSAIISVPTKGGVTLYYNVETDQFVDDPTAKPINPTYKQWTAEVTHITQDDYLNVRTGAGASYPNLPSYPRLALGNRVDVVSEALADDGRIWFQIRIAGKYYGYVRSDYLQPLTEIKIAKVDHVQRLIVRSEPKVSKQTVYKLYPALAKTNYVEVLDSSDRFFDRIRFQDQKGGYHIAYASRYYLERV